MANKENINLQEETTTLPTAQLEGILARLNKLEEKNKPVSAKRVTERIARLRFHEGKPVNKYKNYHEKRDMMTGHDIAYMDIYLLGSDTPIEVLYLDFLTKPNYAQVLIKAQRVQESVESGGKITSENPDPHKVSGATYNPHAVDLEVVSEHRELTVEVLEGEFAGQTFVVSDEALNASC